METCVGFTPNKWRPSLCSFCYHTKAAHNDPSSAQAGLLMVHTHSTFPTRSIPSSPLKTSSFTLPNQLLEEEELTLPPHESPDFLTPPHVDEKEVIEYCACEYFCKCGLPQREEEETDIVEEILPVPTKPPLTIKLNKTVPIFSEASKHENFTRSFQPELKKKKKKKKKYSHLIIPRPSSVLSGKKKKGSKVKISPSDHPLTDSSHSQSPLPDQPLTRSLSHKTLQNLQNFHVKSPLR
jgi:hypothetical protein